MNTKVMFSSNSNEWTTPDDLYQILDSEFHFTLDAASTDENAKCPRHFTAEDNGLEQNWGGAGGFLQPSIRQRCRQVGEEMLRREQKRRCRSPADSCKDGHQILPRIYLSQVYRNEIHPGQIEIRRLETVGSFPLNASYIQ